MTILKIMSPVRTAVTYSCPEFSKMQDICIPAQLYCTEPNVKNQMDYFV